MVEINGRAARVIVTVGLLAGLLTGMIAGPARAIAIQRVVSPGGIEAWLVEDHKIPVLALELVFLGGAAMDPADKAGLAQLTASLLDEGAGPYDSQEFQRRLDDRGISLGFDAGQDYFSGSLRTLADTQGEAFDLLRLALTAPRFEAADVTRERNAMLASIKRDLNNPQSEARRRFYAAEFPDHPYGREVGGTLDSLPRITAEDLRAEVAGRLTKDRLMIAVCGDITPDRLAAALDHSFGALAAQGSPDDVAPVVPRDPGGTLVVSRPTAQSIIMVGQRGVLRADPDWFAALIVNHVLGGGGFGARLMQEIRVKRGLTYGIYSALAPYAQAGLIVAGGATVNDKAGEVLSLIKAEWQRMAEHGVTDEELADAKTYLTGSLPLQFTSTSAIARIILQVRRDKLGIDYLDRRNALIDAVTKDDVARTAGRLLDLDRLTAVVVGQPAGLTPAVPTEGAAPTEGTAPPANVPPPPRGPS
ncbi:MAG: insulinase family protein [Azospirillum sp.]|nr:insulinase family protein [Azospirillum sp.]